MPLVKVKENFQITLPASIRGKYKVAVGDYVEAEETEQGILIRPVKVVRTNEVDKQ